MSAREKIVDALGHDPALDGLEIVRRKATTPRSRAWWRRRSTAAS